jgi:hypothetical protein
VGADSALFKRGGSGSGPKAHEQSGVSEERGVNFMNVPEALSKFADKGMVKSGLARTVRDISNARSTADARVESWRVARDRIAQLPQNGMARRFVRISSLRYHCA